MRLFPDFDDNLRQAFRQETEMLVESVIAENRSVLDLLTANYTFLNERLAKHYGIPNIYGSRFRRVAFDDPAPKTSGDPGQRRGGLLRQGSILLVTSYPTRTSPVIRGKWILENVMGVPPPPPPASVPPLDDVKGVKKSAPVRERLAEHRKNPTCAACHRLTDPVGFALENYDAVGRWRTLDGGEPIDASGTLFNGTELNGVAGLQKAILDRPELFVSTLTEKLLTFATGRGVAYYDAPAIRKIVRDASAAELPLLVDRHGYRHERALPYEDLIMIIFKKALPRRTFLRGVGATVALPLLDAMIPSMTAYAQTPAKAVKRLGFVYIPMGSDIARWTPPGEGGALTELSVTLSPLAPVMKHLTVLSNMELRNAYPGTHATSNAAFLSAAKAKWTESSDYFLGTTVDQIAAQQMGQETQLPSLELAMDLMEVVGQCDNGYACVYQNNLSWSSPTTPLPSEAHPRVVFERLFGEGGSTAQRRAALGRRASLLDWVREDISRLQRELGATDRTQGERVPRHRARSGAPHSEGRSADARESAARPRSSGRRSRRRTRITRS